MSQGEFVDQIRHYRLPKDFVLVSELHQITDWDELCRLKKKTVIKKTARRQVLARMEEVLPRLLPGIHDWRRLGRMLRQVDKIDELKKQIMGRISEIVQQTRDLDELLEIQHVFPRLGHLSIQLAGQTFDALSDQLPGISNWDRLVEIREMCLNNNDLCWRIDDRIVDVLLLLLPSISNWEQLANMCANVFDSLDHCCQIEERMVQLINTVTLEDYPDWFSTLLRESYRCNTHKPDYCLVKAALDQKVGELKAQLASV